MKRPYGSGQTYEKWGSYYVCWRTADGRRLNRRLGPKRATGESDGLTRAQAERAARVLIEAEGTSAAAPRRERSRTVDDAAKALRERLAIEGARLSYRQNCESMQRVHISPSLGKRKVDAVATEDVERLARALLAKGLSPKTVRNTMTFLH
jgi:hypothetical protein